MTLSPIQKAVVVFFQEMSLPPLLTGLLAGVPPYANSWTQKYFDLTWDHCLCTHRGEICMKLGRERLKLKYKVLKNYEPSLILPIDLKISSVKSKTLGQWLHAYYVILTKQFPHIYPSNTCREWQRIYRSPFGVRKYSATGKEKFNCLFT